jgi:UTP--glucose-1-phosphate uridylyltransferase
MLGDCHQVVEGKAISSYGVLDVKPVDGRFGGSALRNPNMVEKPKLEDAPSDLAVIGRYILTPTVFETLAETKAGVGRRTATHRRHAPAPAQERKNVRLRLRRPRHDTGDKLGFLKATVEFALKRKDLGGPLREYLKGLKL